jgi:hypothetical protein
LTDGTEKALPKTHFCSAFHSFHQAGCEGFSSTPNPSTSISEVFEFLNSPLFCQNVKDQIHGSAKIRRAEAEPISRQP